MSSRLVLRETWGQIWKYLNVWIMVFTVILLSIVALQLVFSMLQTNLQMEMFGKMAKGEAPELLPPYMLYFLLASVGYWLISAGTRALISVGVFSIEENGDISFQHLLRQAWSKVPKVFGVDLILVGPFAILYWWLFLTIFRDMQSSFGPLQNGGEIAVTPPGTMALIPLLICGTFIIIVPLITLTLYASNAAVLENHSPLNAIKEGFQFISGHLSSVVRLTILLIVVYIVVSIIMAIVMLPVTLISMAPLQLAMMECMPGTFGTTENLDVMNKCVAEAQQTPTMRIVQIITVLISSSGNAVLALVLFVSTSLLFYRLRRPASGANNLQSVLT